MTFAVFYIYQYWYFSLNKALYYNNMKKNFGACMRPWSNLFRCEQILTWAICITMAIWASIKNNLIWIVNSIVHWTILFATALNNVVRLKFEKMYILDFLRKSILPSVLKYYAHDCKAWKRSRMGMENDWICRRRRSHAKVHLCCQYPTGLRRPNLCPYIPRLCPYIPNLVVAW